MFDDGSEQHADIFRNGLILFQEQVVHPEQGVLVLERQRHYPAALHAKGLGGIALALKQVGQVLDGCAEGLAAQRCFQRHDVVLG
jgi:hypothetical protein